MPGLFIEYPDNCEAYVFRGMEKLHQASAKELASLPMLSLFGGMYMREYATQHFGQTA